MKKRLLSILLMCCMVLTLLPMTAYAMTLTVRPVEISSGRYATVDDLETKSGAVITLGKNSRGRNGNQKWYVFGKDNGVNGRNTVLFAATSLTDPSGFEQREVFQRVLGATRIDYDSSWGSSYTDGAAAPTEVDISYYAASYSRWRLRNTIAHDNKLFNRVEKALLNETPYKNTDLGNNNRVYTLKDKLYLPAIKASEEDTIYIGSNDQIRLKSIRVQSTQADYCNAAWSRTAFDHQNVSAYSVSIDSSIYTGKKLVHNFYTDQFGTDHVVWGDTAAMLPATNLDLDKVLFASMVPIQEELSSGSGAGEVRTGSVDETSINYPMTLRLDAEQHGKNLGELYVNREKGEIYAKSSLGGPRQPRVWLVVQTSYMDVNNEHTFSRYWCKDIGNDSELTDEYGFVHVKLDDIVFGNNITKLSSLDNCKIWLEASFDNAANSASSAVYTYAVEPKPLPEVTVTTITKFFDPESGEELTSASSTETSTIHAGDTFTYSYKNKPYISPDKIVNNKNKEVQQETSDYYLKRFRIDNVWEDLTVELTINHYCAAYSWDTVEETPATCTETGLTKGVTCTICGRVIEERKEIPALGHDLKVVNTATCDTSGHIISTCQREGCTYKTVVSTPALGHDWGEPETVSATCTEGGLVKKTCKRDPSHVETVTSGPLGHDWEEDFTVDVQPTCETDGSKSRHCTRCDEKTDVTEIPAPGHDSSWTCSIDVTVEAPKCGTVVEKRKTYSPEPPPVVTTPEDAPYWLLRSQHPESTDACWCTVDGKTFTGTIIGGQTYCAEFYLEPKAGSPFFVPDEEDIRDHLTIHGGALGSLKRYTKNIEFNVLVTAVHDYDENGICRGCGVADHEHSFEEVWSTDESSHWHACAQDGCTATEDLEAHSFGEDNATCETCGYVRTITCQHDFGTYLCDDEQHWKECRKPGCNVVISRGKHTLSPSYRNGVLEYWWCQTCNSYETHEHDIADEWKTSGSHHWKQCFVSSGYCKFVSDYAEHVYDSETGTECVTCGYTRTICGHTYSEGFNSWDETSHWRECTNPVCTDRSGSQKDKAAHTFNSYGDCTVCGYRHTEHAYGEWHYDGSEHWKTCTKPGCQAQTGKSGHTYSGDICSVCGYDRSITPAHTHFYGEWSRDSREHWRECTDPNCPEENGRIINRDAHVYDDDADTTCNVCKYERSAAPDHSGGHVYGDWSWDINSHWHECTDADCTDKTGSIKDKAAHSYDDDTDPYCNDCGYVRSTKFSHTHTFDGWRYNAERHYRICSAEDCPYWGEKMDSAPHVYDDDQDEFCNVCAYGRFGTQHEHTYGDWTADGETGHYRVCAAENCPYADKGRVTEAHSYDDDADMICDTCGYDRTVTPPAEYTVRFNANGGGGTMADVTGVSGSYTLPACGFTEPEGKQFKGWSTSADGSVISGTTYEVSSDTTFYAIWESKEYSIIVTDGKATIGAGSEISKAAQGTTITLTANAAPDGKVFDKWVVESGSTTLEDANSETTTFIMPDSEVSVKATYKNAPVTTYSLTTQVNGGHGTISASKTGLTEGSTETVIFTPDDGYEIDIVTVNGVATDVLSNILNVTMDADKTVIVTYKAIPHTHTYDQEIQKPETLKSAADCTNDEVYFKSCSCGEISTTETFTAAGTQLGHAWASDWSKDTDNHWKECSRCHEKKDEAAHDYGSDNICDTCGYNKTVPHTHNLTLVPAKAPTCTEKGNTAYYTCDGCDKWFEDATGASEITDKTSVILAATGHSASDWKSDNTDHWKECTVVGCGVIIEDSKAAHTAGEWIIDTPATDTTDGSKHKECTVCGYTMTTETIPATGGGEHTHSYGSDWKNDADNHWHECSCGDKKDTAAHIAGEWIIDTPATSTTSGSKHKECTVCGYTMTTETIPATGGEHTHNYGSEWKNDADNHWHECSCGDKKDTAAHTAGEWIIDTPATATTSGTKHKKCTVCGYTMATETIPATGGGEHTHSYGSDWKNDADNHWHECSCGDKADKAAHDFKWVVDKEATATQKGSKHEECKVCGYKKAAVEIPATGNTD